MACAPWGGWEFVGVGSLTPKRKLVGHDLAVMAVDHDHQMAPAVPAAGDVRDIHRPAFVPDRFWALALLGNAADLDQHRR